MARLTFSNVPTATGGVISGNIGIGAGSPFGEGGKYGAQVADIQRTIASAPEGFYDPVGWDDFLRKEELYSEQLPEGVRIYGIEDPEVMEDILAIPSTVRALQELSVIRKRYLGHMDRPEYKTGSQYSYDVGWGRGKRETVSGDKLATRIKNLKEYIAFSFDRVLKEKNAPLIQAIEQSERQLEIDQAVQIALEQKIRETATPTPSFVITDPISPVSYLPFAVVGIVLVVILLFLRRKA